MVTANITKIISNGFGTFVTMKGAKKVPYIARLYDKANKAKPYNWGDYAKTGSSAMVQYNAPFWGKIVSAPVPSAGTKTVIVYVSKTGKDYTWDRRISFTIKKDKSITYKKWRVK
ncbi:hypothetical protein J6TS2_48460 [Heyndrickxia sporothermodurans]|nr:hypothetical protein J6TS2_48460 [Heyndrickxia sporothermodurans]